MSNFERLVLVASLILLAGCSSLHVNPLPTLSPQTDWVANSAEWATEARQVYGEATSYVEMQSKQRQTGSWAVVLDVDETILNNVGYQISIERRGADYSPETWYNWTQKGSATLVPGALEFMSQVNALGGHVALVTNRRDREQLATENNLAALGIERGEEFEILLTRASPNGASTKDTRFDIIDELLAAHGTPNVTIIAYVGDSEGDKPEGPGSWRFFCINQGGMYGQPCASASGSGQ